LVEGEGNRGHFENGQNVKKKKMRNLRRGRNDEIEGLLAETPAHASGGWKLRGSGGSHCLGGEEGKKLNGGLGRRTVTDPVLPRDAEKNAKKGGGVGGTGCKKAKAGQTLCQSSFNVFNIKGMKQGSGELREVTAHQKRGVMLRNGLRKS